MAEYVCRRKLTLAAMDLLRGDQKVIDIALKYGYNSQAAFARAFKEQIGVQPSVVTADVNMKLYPRMSLRNVNEWYRIEKGRKKLVVKLTKIDFVTFGNYNMVGKAMRTVNGLGGVGEFWKKCFEEGMYDPLMLMKEYIPAEIDEYVGYMNNYDNDKDSFNYVVGMFMKPNVPVPDGYVSYEVPELTVAQAWIEGEELEIYNNAYFLITEALNQHGYDADWEHFYWAEVYTDQRFGIPKSKGEKILTLDYYMPCVKRK